MDVLIFVIYLGIVFWVVMFLTLIAIFLTDHFINHTKNHLHH